MANQINPNQQVNQRPLTPPLAGEIQRDPARIQRAMMAHLRFTSRLNDLTNDQLTRQQETTR